MKIAPGVRLGPYEIVAPIGAGGMGEVYRARDTRLDRTVAIKVLPAALAQNAQLRLRFEREAKAISALTHPHICTLHDVGSHDGVEFLVMEHLDGESLADRLSRGPLPLDETIRYAIEIADALDKAHRRGIVHRDLKPGNIMITRTGGAKLLDFGLARTIETAAPDPESATMVASQKPLTEEGTIVGTMQYMAPEQLDSRPADARTDIFAFGAVLYEMLTGQRAFSGKTRSSLIASIVATEPPPVSAMQPLAPASLERIIRICLLKDPDERWQSAHDLKLELQGLAIAAQTQHAGASRTKRGIAGWIAAALVATGAVAWFVVERANHRPARTARFEIAPPPNTRFNATDGPVAISPDGRQLIMRVIAGEGAESLWLRPLDGTAIRKIRGTEGGFDAFWSPDGRQIGFFAAGKLKRLDLASSASVTIAPVQDTRGGTWAGDTILFSASPLGPIVRVSTNGGTPRPVTKLDASRKETGHWRPLFLPDGKQFLFVARSANEDLSGVYVGSIEHDRVRRVLDVATAPVYTEPGYLLFANENTLYAQPFDSDAAKTTGPAFVVAQQVEYSGQYGSPGYSAGGGVLAWNVRSSPGTGSPIVKMAWDGKQTVLKLDGHNLDISRDGTRLAASHVETLRGNQDLWTYDLRRDVSSRLTYDPADEAGAVWSPDGKRIAYSVTTPTGASLKIRPAGTGTEEVVLQHPIWLEPVAWSSDGRTLIVEVGSMTDRIDLVTLDVITRKVTPLLNSPFEEHSARFSPDGKWIAYESDESGRPEISIVPYPPDGTRVQVSAGGGFAPRWHADGRTLSYLRADRTLASVPVNVTPAGIEVGAPKGNLNIGSIDYVVIPDGSGVLFSRERSTTTTPIVVVTNWAGSR